MLSTVCFAATISALGATALARLLLRAIPGRWQGVLVGFAAGVLLFYLAFSVAIDWRFCVAALLMVGFFLLEIVTTVLRRLRRGSRLAGGDRSHSYDKMRMHGSSMWTTLTRCSLVQGLFMAGGLAVVTISSDTWAVVAAAGSVLIAVLLLWAFGGLTSVETGGTPGA